MPRKIKILGISNGYLPLGIKQKFLYDYEHARNYSEVDSMPIDYDIVLWDKTFEKWGGEDEVLLETLRNKKIGDKIYFLVNNDRSEFAMELSCKIVNGVLKIPVVEEDVDKIINELYSFKLEQMLLEFS
ncbi:MAG: hypothetical protein CMH64_00720 [Nanoarchaeota archaeon]|nr:hypothetical protein [Nanoarchaeota archaeon]|tara:strand:- start:340 stop:726 length:387 start_codon:yes stop_codon:yes gene_type:complete